MSGAPPARAAPCHGLLGGRVHMARAADAGRRPAIDPVLLAAAVPARAGETAVDLGAGAGAAALCLAARVAGLRVIGVERDPALTRAARGNAAASGLCGRVSFVCADIRRPPPLEPCDRAMLNPPFLPPERAAPRRRGDAATVEDGAGIADWIAAALRLLRPRGGLTAIHRADRVDALLAALHGRAGAVCVYPLWPKAGRAARRVLVSARKGSRAPARVAPGLALHRADGSYTAEAEAVLWRAAPLDLMEERNVEQHNG